MSNNEEIKELKSLLEEASTAEREIARPRQRVKRSPLAKLLVLKGENLKEFEELHQNFLADTNPHTKIEIFLCEKIISAIWELRRLAEIKKNVLNEQNAITEEEQMGMSGFVPENGPRKRIRNIKKVRLDAEIQQLMQYQIELEKLVQKWIERLHEERGLKKRKRSINPP
jgi:hypothetical protein